MAINLTKTETVPAPLQPHLATFLPLLNKETLIEVVLGLNSDLTAAKVELDTMTKRLREAEAALGVPFNDEWDSWSDAALKTLD
jgi:hypothetical protein